MPLTVEPIAAAAALVLDLSGDLTGAVDDAAALLHAIASLPPPTAVVLDLTGLSLINTGGVRALQAFLETLADRGLTASLVLLPDDRRHRKLRRGDLARHPLFGTAADALADAVIADLIPHPRRPL